MDGKTEVVNTSLVNLLRCLTREHGGTWDAIMPQVEFAYNDSVNRSTYMSPSEVVYGRYPSRVFELRKMNGLEKRSGHAEEFAEAMVEVHEHVKQILQQNSSKVKAKADLKRRNVQFQVGNLVMVHLNKYRLPQSNHTKLMMNKIGPREILEKYGENA